ncbi:MAG: DUF2059 domain-containing protein [Albidovulum sp.]
MRPVFLATLLATGLAVSGPARAADVDGLVAVLQLPEIFEVLAAEGEAYGKEIDANMLDGAGGASWAAAVHQIYAPDRLLAEFSTALEAALPPSGTDFAPVIEFFGSGLGQQATTLEISARRALLDPDVEDASRLTLEEMRAENDPRVALVADFVEVNDLVESNVSNGLNANFAFYQGLRDGGAIGPEMSEDDVVAEVWSQEEAIRGETDIWVHAYLTMAYAPLSDEDIKRYTDFTRRPDAQVMNRAMTEAYAEVFRDVSRQLGRAAGVVLAGQSL